jgi:uncharacterized protein (TIGR03083 family)
MDTDEIWRHTHRERSRLADLLETLSAQEWERPSLCPGWTVRDVAAHVIASAMVTPLGVLTGMVRARGNFDRLMLDTAKRASARPTREIVADYRRLSDSRSHPLGTSILDPLGDVLVHTQDIAIPLGRDVPMDPEAARLAAGRVWTSSFPFGAQKRLKGVELVASDAEWTVGAGPRVEGPMGQLLLLMTGRDVALRALSGPGVRELSGRAS